MVYLLSCLGGFLSNIDLDRVESEFQCFLKFYLHYIRLTSCKSRSYFEFKWNENELDFFVHAIKFMCSGFKGLLFGLTTYRMSRLCLPSFFHCSITSYCQEIKFTEFSVQSDEVYVQLFVVQLYTIQHSSHSSRVTEMLELFLSPCLDLTYISSTDQVCFVKIKVNYTVIPYQD